MAGSVAPMGYQAAHPVTLTEVKEYLRVTGTEQDTVISSLIEAASDYAETFTGLTIRPTRFQFKLDHFPYGYTSVPGLYYGSDQTMNDSPYYNGSSIILPRMPLYEAAEDDDLISVQYTNTSGASTALTLNTDFLVEQDSMPGRIYLLYNGTWPATRAIQGAVVIQFTAGFRPNEDADQTSNSLPDGIRLAIKMLVNHWYEHREPIIVGGNVNNVPMAVESLLWSHRIVSFA